MDVLRTFLPFRLALGTLHLQVEFIFLQEKVETLYIDVGHFVLCRSTILLRIRGHNS